MAKELLKKGDKVVMHTCIEAENEKYNGKIWTCRTDEVVKGEGCYKQGLVFLENFNSSFDTSFLQKINIENNWKYDIEILLKHYKTKLVRKEVIRKMGKQIKHIDYMQNEAEINLLECIISDLEYILEK